jgi:hypothetical protein
MVVSWYIFSYLPLFIIQNQDRIIELCENRTIDNDYNYFILAGGPLYLEQSTTPRPAAVVEKPKLELLPFQMLAAAAAGSDRWVFLVVVSLLPSIVLCIIISPL